MGAVLAGIEVSCSTGWVCVCCATYVHAVVYICMCVRLLLGASVFIGALTAACTACVGSVCFLLCTVVVGDFDNENQSTQVL